MINTFPISETKIAAKKRNIKDYLALCKINVILLMLVTAFVGACLATNMRPDLLQLTLGLIGIALVAASGAAFNHGIDQQRDKLMARTRHRPLVNNKLSLRQVYGFATLILILGFSLLYFWVNPLTAILSLASMVGYALIYSHWLKPLTPQNITIGGLAGAMPPLLGWVAMTGETHPLAWVLVLIIFTWTPPHFWALAYYRQQEYAKAKVPMLSVTHGKEFTSLQMLLYTLLLSLVTLLPYLLHFSNEIYLVGSMLCNGMFIYLSIRLLIEQTTKRAQQTFRYSIVYLLLIFILIMLDRLISL
ncbi:MAG: heme o synthase [Oleispira antarctica]|uniref:Protoheme IX farnesyltransferase n=1 Tax=Oleispira antarctica RB-8 TaxID=698738 RepID=R4YSL3_OLEAN|nr:heme o synthase [Oleispira antarctica]MBQ0791700.1 heme o synthase [Oleispira antarctica]CCK75129.1 Protoheme IX farnesyltransferase [Oleispira antarctica RB-8]